MNLVDYIIVFSFLGLTFFVGAIFYRWVGEPDDFYLAGRKLTPFILAAVLTATNVNLYSFVGQAGIVYKHGISIIWQTWTGNMALVFAGLLVIPIFRRLRIRTIPEFLEQRYARGVRVMVAVLWVFRLTFWLGIVLYVAVVAAQAITEVHSFTFWVCVFGVVAMVYTMLGGMWSVAFTDVMQFVIMLAGALIVLPLSMSAVGWFPSLAQTLPSGALDLIPQAGDYDWKFILAIFLLGIEWACVDQGMLQRAFGAESTKTVAKGLVLAGIATTPFALLWNLPGLAAARLYPGLENPDSAIPTLLANLLPHGILGLVVCGLISAQLSTISANLNGVATLFTNDIYTGILKRNPTNKDILFVARLVTLIAGVGMILFSYWVPQLGGAVESYLTIIGIMDMPLWIVAILYGLLWKRTNHQAAIAGYLAGALAGIFGKFYFGFNFNLTTFMSAGVALITTPLVAWLTKLPDHAKVAEVWAAKSTSEEEIKQQEVYHIIPRTVSGKLGIAFALAGLVMFLTGVILGGVTSFAAAGMLAVGGMIVFFAGGLWRAYAD